VTCSGIRFPERRRANEMHLCHRCLSRAAAAAAAAAPSSQLSFNSLKSFVTLLIHVCALYGSGVVMCPDLFVDFSSSFLYSFLTLSFSLI